MQAHSTQVLTVPAVPEGSESGEFARVAPEEISRVVFSFADVDPVTGAFYSPSRFRDVSVVQECFECGELECRSPQDCAAVLAQRSWVVCPTCRGQRCVLLTGARAGLRGRWVDCRVCLGVGVYEVGELCEVTDAPLRAVHGCA